MASILRIKRSGTAGDPTTLGQGELAYSSLADNGSNGGDRLYIGTGTEVAGNAVNHEVIGGKYFTSKLDHALGTLTPNSAILVDANSKIDVLNVDNITLNGNTVSTTNSNGGLILAPNGTGTTTINSVVFGTTVDAVGKRIVQVGTPTADSDAATKAYVDAVTAGQTFTIGDGSATDTFNAASGTLLFSGLTGITTAVTNDAVSFDLDDTSVTAGDYGSATAIPTFTVDGQGRLTAAGTASISTSLNVQGDTIPLASQSLLFASSGDGISFAYDSGTNTATYSMATATTSAKGVASFATADFGVSSGAVSLNDAVVKGVGANAGNVVPTGHSFDIKGDSSQGITTSGDGYDCITVTVADATVSTKGVASFATADFGVSSGAVSLNDAVLKTITTDTGAGLTPSSHGISIVGGEGVDVTHAGAVITVTGEDATYTNKGIASFDTNDFTVTSGAVSLKSGSVANADLANDGIVIGSTDVSLGGTITSLVGLTNVTVDDLTLNGNVISTPSSVNDIILDPKGGDSAGGRVIIQGDLLVQGTETIVNSTTMTINDKNLVLADSAADATAANGAGLTINGASATLQYAVTGDKWVANKDFDAPELFRNGVAIEEYIEDIMGASIAVGEGLDFAYNDAAGTHTFTAELATITNKGVASYDSDQFTVTSGAVTVSTLDGGTY